MRVITFEEPGRVRVGLESPAELEPGCVRVRTIYSGVSAGTELTAYRGTNPYLTRKWDTEQRLFLDGQTHAYPLTGWGYQEVGEVVEAAPDVADPPVGHLVWGIWGHRAEAVVPADKLVGHVLPPGADPLVGVFARVGAIALNAVHAADVHLGDQIAVFGQGVIGLLATRLAVLSGARVRGRRRASRPGSSSPRRTARPRRSTSAAGSVRRVHPQADRGCRHRHRAERQPPGPARGDQDRPPGRPGRGRRASTRATASGCGSARSSTTTRCSSSPPRSAASPPGSPTAGTSSGSSAPSWTGHHAVRSTSPTWSATSSPVDGRGRRLRPDRQAPVRGAPARFASRTHSKNEDAPKRSHREARRTGAASARPFPAGEVRVRGRRRVRRDRAAREGRPPLRQPADRAQAGLADGVVMPTVCVDMPHFIGDFDPAKRMTRSSSSGRSSRSSPSSAASG